MMPVKRGRLKPEDEYKISRKNKYLVDNFDPENGCLDYLYSEQVFDYHDKDFVLNGGEKTQQGRTERFIDRLLNAGRDAYQKFLTGLKETGDEHIAEELESTEVPEANKKDPFSWIEELPDSVKHQIPSVPDASRLSPAFGKGWEHIFMQLGFSKAKIEQSQMSNPHSISVAVASLINSWRQKNAKNAHYIILLNTMKEASDVCTIDWDLVETVVKANAQSMEVNS